MIRRKCRRDGHRFESRNVLMRWAQSGGPWQFCYRWGCSGSRVEPQLEAHLREADPNLLGILRNT